MSPPIKIIMAQLNLLVGDIESNTNKVIDAAKTACFHHGADLIVFPELTVTGYPPEDLLLRNGLYERVEVALNKIKNEVGGIDVVVGYPVRTAVGRFNAAALIGEGEIKAVYYKQMLPNYSVFDEKRYFDAGQAPCVVEVKGVKIGLSICEDIWYPTPAQQAVQAGAQLIINLNASPFHLNKRQQRIDIVAEQARFTRCPVVYVNLIGGQDELVFDGGSFVVDATGKLAQIEPCFEEGLYLVEFTEHDGAWCPKPRRIVPSPPMIESVYRALVLGARDYIQKNGFTGAIIGLSGGIDSALTLAIAVDAIGAENVEAVMMPSRYTSELSLHDAEKEAKSLNVNYRVLSIEPVFKAFLETLKDTFKNTEPDVTEENVQARCRGVMLMAISNKSHKIVLTTGNKSELAVGYATLYGDMVGGFNVLKDVPKTLVYKLVDYRNTLSPAIPQSVIHRAPSAELAPDQKDTDSLPDYGELDSILEMYIEQDKCVDDIVVAGYNRATVRRVVRMVDKNEYKRRQAAPGVRISTKAFGRDRRYPITSGFNK